MKCFIYTITAKRGYRGVAKTVKLYEVKRSILAKIGERDYTFESDFQAAFNLMEELKVLPRKYFAKSEVHGGHIESAYSLREKQVAAIFGM